MHNQGNSGIGGESMSILDTLITDRTQADVNRIKNIMQKGLPRMTAEEKMYFLKGQLEALDDSTADALVDSNGLTIGCRDGALPKGSYNYTDLNRVMDAVEYLTGVIRSAGYEIDDPVPITKTRNTHRTVKVNYVLKNKVANPTFSDGTSFSRWGVSTYTGFSNIALVNNAGKEFVQVDMGVNLTGASWFLSSSYLQWKEADKGSMYYWGCQYLLNEGNESHISFNLQTRTNESGSNIANQQELTSEQGQIIGFGELFTADKNEVLMRIVPCISAGAKLGESYFMRRPFVYNLTEIFGKGNEPSIEWCREHIGYDGKTVVGFYEHTTEETETTERYAVQDIPTVSEMTTYLSNIQRVISRLPLVNVRYDTIPTLPEDMDALLPAEANNIEKVLPLIVDTVERILTERLAFYSGDLYGGEV